MLRRRPGRSLCLLALEPSDHPRSRARRRVAAMHLSPTLYSRRCILRSQCSQNSFRAWQFTAFLTHGHLHRLCKCLEYRFDLMVLDRPLGLYIQVAERLVRKRFEEMEEHLCRHLADLFAFEFGIPNDPVSPAKIDSDLCEAIIHRQ